VEKTHKKRVCWEKYPIVGVSTQNCVLGTDLDLLT